MKVENAACLVEPLTQLDLTIPPTRLPIRENELIDRSPSPSRSVLLVAGLAFAGGSNAGYLGEASSSAGSSKGRERPADERTSFLAGRGSGLGSQHWYAARRSVLYGDDDTPQEALVVRR